LQEQTGLLVSILPQLEKLKGTEVWFVDRQEWGLLSAVFAEELVMDYSKLFSSQ
jgi:hypothetical protein